MPPRLASDDPIRVRDRQIAKDAIARTSQILISRPDATPSSKEYNNIPRLDRRSCPKLGPCTVDVYNTDTFAVAERLSHSKTDKKPVLVLNMANGDVAGGGFLNGTRAQEEELCRRSTLYACLQEYTYPLPPTVALYHPTVVVFVDTECQPILDWDANLPVVSVVSAATAEGPELTTKGSKVLYANPEDEKLQKTICQTILRVAGKEKHRNVVLGAIGCGAFYHPLDEAVRIWAEVLADSEFEGWFENVAFAVLSFEQPKKGDTSYNYVGFHAGLQRLVVGGKGVKVKTELEEEIDREVEDEVRRMRKRAPRLEVDVDKAEAYVSTSKRRARTPSRARTGDRGEVSIEDTNEKQQADTRRIANQSSFRDTQDLKGTKRLSDADSQPRTDFPASKPDSQAKI